MYLHGFLITAQVLLNRPDRVYYLDEVNKDMTPKRKRQLERFLNGQTMELHEERELIPEYVLDRFYYQLAKENKK
jgi:hypothetical protein